MGKDQEIFEKLMFLMEAKVWKEVIYRVAGDCGPSAVIKAIQNSGSHDEEEEKKCLFYGRKKN